MRRTLLNCGATLVAALVLVVATGAAPVSATGRTYSAITAGGLHTCGLTTQGRAYCWGRNFEGQLGDGTTTSSNANGPQLVFGGLRFASISAGGFHTCGLTAQGRAYCWGYNDNGQLGDGTATYSSERNGPQPVIGGLKFTSISTGSYHTCGLTLQGRAYCWGFNESGQLGDGTTRDSGANGPQLVIDGLRFASISAGPMHTCGLTSYGVAYCWGENSYGELGDGTVSDSNNNGPQRVMGGHMFASISANGVFTCGLTSQGRTFCWGANYFGQIGNGTLRSSGASGPQQVIGGLRFATISAGSYHTCGLTSRGTSYCWGWNEIGGQLGDGTATYSSDTNGPQPVIGGLRFATISAGSFHTCGLTARGAAYCWGYNYNGQLGDGTRTDSNANGPQAVQ